MSLQGAPITIFLYFFPQTSFAVGVLTRGISFTEVGRTQKTVVDPAVAPVAPGDGSDPHSKNCCGPVASAVAPVAPAVTP